MKRDVSMRVRLTAGELARVRALALKDGRTVSDYVRRALVRRRAVEVVEPVVEMGVALPVAPTHVNP